MESKTITIINDIFNIRIVNDYFKSYFKKFDFEKYNYELEDYDIKIFNDDEKEILLNKLKGNIVLIIQPLQYKFLEIFLLKIQKLLSKGKKIILVITYLCYLRQGKEFKEKLGEMIVKSLLNYENIIKIIVIDPHVTLDIKSEKYEEISGSDLVFNEINEKLEMLENCCILSPDNSSSKKNDILAKKLNIDNIISNKKRDKNGEITRFEIKNYKYHRNIFIVDDIIDTGNTVLQAINTYLNMYEKYDIKNDKPIFFIYCTHGVLSNVNKDLMKHKDIISINISSSYFNSIIADKIKNLDNEEKLFKICADSNLSKKIKIFNIADKIYERVKKTIDSI